MLLEKQELENKFQKELLQTRIEAQEQTMDHLSKEMHDNIGQLMSSAKLFIGISKRTLPNCMETLMEADQTLGYAIQELRALSKSLNKEWLAQFNLIENLSREVNRINASKEFIISLNHPTEINMSVERQLILFRIIQESLQNAIKHGNASYISINLEAINNLLNITIQDNGQGFEAEDSSKHGVGIINIKQRVAILNGTVSWQSAIGQTTVFIKLPLHGIHS